MPKGAAKKPDSSNDPIVSVSIVDAVTERIRDDVIQGTLPAGMPIHISGLSDRLGVSSIPVREALRGLEREGMIERQRHGRGVAVAPLTTEGLRDIYQLRLKIEPDLAARTVEGITDADVAELRRLLDEMHEQISTSPVDVLLISRLHNEFHRAIVAPAATEWDLRVLGMLWQASERYTAHVFATWGAEERIDTLRGIHEPLYDAAADHAPERVSEALVTHLVDGLDQLADAMPHQPAVTE